MKNIFFIILLFLVAFAICQEDGTDDEATVSMTSTAIEAETTETAIDTATSTIPTATSIIASDETTQATSTIASDETAQPTSIESEIPTVNKTVNPIVCQNLQQLYKSLNGNAWIVRTGWDSTDMSTCCSWYNVHCNTIGQVLKL